MPTGACTRTKGSVCAAPGTTHHGRGVAVDVGRGLREFGSKQHGWTSAPPGQSGFVQPDWARKSGNKPEPWHWELTGARPRAPDERSPDLVRGYTPPDRNPHPRA